MKQLELRREVLWLVLGVLAVDAIFAGAYFIGRVRSAPDAVKVGYTVLWTVVTLGVVIRGLTRIRTARLGPGITSRS